MESAFSTSDFCDARRDDDGGEFRVLSARFRDFGGLARFFGRVSTVRCFEDNGQVKAAVETPGEGRVLVVDGGASLRRALLGGNLGAAAQKNGWSGVLIDGCVRDVLELRVLALGVRALGSCPRPPEKRGQGERDVPIQVQGVWIRPGDWLYADEDGAVISQSMLRP